VTVAQLVDRERSRLNAAILARGIGVALAVAAVIIAASTLALGRARWITRPGAPLVAWVVAIVIAAAILWWTRRDARRSATSGAIAQAIERERALRAGSLRGALEVSEMGALGRHAAEAVAGRLAGSGRVLAPTLHRTALRRGLIALLAALTALVLLGTAREAAPDGWRALRHPVGALTGSILAPLRIVDVPRSVMRGDTLRVRIEAPDRRSLSLHVRTTGAAWRALALPVARGTAATMLGPLDADMKIFASDGRVTSDTLIVHVTDRPFVGDVAIRAIYPRYLDRPAEPIPVGEPARVPRGTVLAISGRASTTLAHISLVHGRDTLTLDPDGHTFAGRMVAAESGRWSWLAASGEGPIADLPSALDLDVVPDSAPHVEILAPEQDTVVLADAQVALQAAATDDHGISSIVLRSRRQMANGTLLPEIAQQLATPRQPQWSGQPVLDLAPRGLEPGDELHLVVAATDNSPWRQTAASRELVLRVPSLSEQRERARAMAESTVSRLSATAKSERDLAQRTSEAAHSRADRVARGDPPSSEEAQQAQQHSMSYQSAENARALAREQQQLQQQVQQAQRDAQALEQQLRAAGVMDSSLTQQLRDVQQLLKEALTPELAQQLQDVLKATKTLSPEALRRAMQNLAEQQQRLREQLERSAEMLRRAALEGSMQTLHDEARDIAQHERALSDSIARGQRGRDSATSRSADALSQRSRDLSKDVADLAKRLQQEKAEAGPQKLQGASQRADSSARAMQRVGGAKRDSAASGSMRDSTANAAEKNTRQTPQPGEQAQQSDRRRASQPSAQQRTDSQSTQRADRQASQQSLANRQASQQAGQQQGAERQAERQADPQANGASPAIDPAQQSQAAQAAAQQMEQAAQQLGDARQSQIQEWKSQITQELDRSIQETMQLARAQQSLADRARTGKRDGLRADQSAVQQGVQKVQERIQKAAQRSAHVSPQSQSSLADAGRRVQEATQEASDKQQRDGQQMAASMDDAAQALNRAAAQMMKDRARAASGSSASGFSEMIEAMRKAAEQQGAVNSQSAGLIPLPGAQPTGQMMARARALAKQQRGIADQVQNAGDGEARAAALAKEMRQIADQLDRGRVDPSLLERQQKLFHKLLDAGLTLEKDEREDTGKRESRTGADTAVIVRDGPLSGRSVVRYREPTWNELRGLTADERRAVLEYFKRINAEHP
jgi:hypothetical protein